MSEQLQHRNLLLGILAVRKNFIGPDALRAALEAWLAHKSKGLGQILREQNALNENQYALLEEGVDDHLAEHGNDAAASLAALRLPDAIRQELASIADADVQASLAIVVTAPQGLRPGRLPLKCAHALDWGVTKCARSVVGHASAPAVVTRTSRRPKIFAATWRAPWAR